MNTLTITLTDRQLAGLTGESKLPGSGPVPEGLSEPEPLPE